MEKLRMETQGLAQSRIRQLAKLFPACVTEMRDEQGRPKEAVDFALLRQMLSDTVLEGDEAYAFTWVGKKAAIAEANRTIRKTLRPCREESLDWDGTGNLYLEGDNLEVLKLLQESYLGAVKMIYIDPPYNTGHDFIYPDSFMMDAEEYRAGSGYFNADGNVNYGRDNENSRPRYHSDWCSMIYSRLLLARNLLHDNGFIAISIGEEESYNLRKICNEVFGEANFRNVVAVRRYDKNLNLQFAADGLSTMNVGLEYLLIYSKNPGTKMTAVYRASSDDRSQTGYWKGFWNNANRPTMRYELLGVTPADGQWKWKKEIADEAVENYREYERNFSAEMTLEEYWVSTGKRKRFIRRKEGGSGKNLGVEHWVAPANRILRNSNWSDLLVSKPAGMDIRFDSPKNTEVLKELIELFGVSGGDTVLDFFSGSAATAQAVMEKNAEDGGNRRFIMVQLPEPCEEKSEAYRAGFSNICEIGKERIRRAAKKIAADCPGGKVDTGFRVFRLDESNMADVFYSAGEYTQDLLSRLEGNIKPDRTSLDLLFGCLLEWGLPLSMPYTSEQIAGCTVHTYNGGDLIACFDEKLPDAVIREIAGRRPLRAVFRDSGFADSPARINVGEMFKMLAPNTRVKVL